uniref:Limonoid UDP-glucosyltransferase n=1 Tax=Anthurium amnicola TaxID=1678845 RepID=A0A1D1XCC6_9ARAE
MAANIPPRTPDAPHVLCVSFTGQGHLNPFLRFARRVAAKGADVTFSTVEDAGHRIRKSSNSAVADGEFTTVGSGRLRFEFFSDGWEVGDPRRLDIQLYLPQLREVGSREVAALIRLQGELGRPVSSVVNNPFIPWVLDVAAGMGIPCGMLWVQSCAVFSVYYHYYHSLADFPDEARPEQIVPLPGVPPLQPHELPSFLLPTNPYLFLTDSILAQFENLHKARWVFANTFMELERDAITGIPNLFRPVIPVGPLVDAPFTGEGEHVHGDLWKAADCMGWLDAQEPCSVVYASVGSVVVLQRDQVVEMAEGLKAGGRPFLWVVRDDARWMLPEGFEEDTAGKGVVVGWSPQERVLAHPSTACFLTHCGWNSTIECLASGVPAIAFPQWGDQVTDAKFLVEVYGVGVHLRSKAPRLASGKGPSFTRADLERCIEEVTRGPRAESMRAMAARWKEATRSAVAEGSSSDTNILAFMEEISPGEPPWLPLPP